MGRGRGLHHRRTGSSAAPWCRPCTRRYAEARRHAPGLHAHPGGHRSGELRLDREVQRRALPGGASDPDQGRQRHGPPISPKKWEASDDLKSWVFHLRDDVTWSNGDKSSPRRTSPTRSTAGSTRRPALRTSACSGAMVETVKGRGRKADEARHRQRGGGHRRPHHQVQPQAGRPGHAGETSTNYPAAIVHRGFGKDYAADLSKNPIGTGPMKLEAFAVGERAILKKAREWWAGPFHLDEIPLFRPRRRHQCLDRGAGLAAGWTWSSGCPTTPSTR